MPASCAFPSPACLNQEKLADLPRRLDFAVLEPGKASRENSREKFNFKQPYRRRFAQTIFLERDLNRRVFFGHFEGGLTVWVVLRKFRSVVLALGELLSLKVAGASHRVCIAK